MCAALCSAARALTLRVQGFNALVDEDRHADLARLYSLLRRVRALPALRKAWCDYIKVC